MVHAEINISRKGIPPERSEIHLDEKNSIEVKGAQVEVDCKLSATRVEVQGNFYFTTGKDQGTLFLIEGVIKKGRVVVNLIDEGDAITVRDGRRINSRVKVTQRIHDEVTGEQG